MAERDGLSGRPDLTKDGIIDCGEGAIFRLVNGKQAYARREAFSVSDLLDNITVSDYAKEVGDYLVDDNRLDRLKEAIEYRYVSVYTIWSVNDDVTQEQGFKYSSRSDIALLRMISEQYHITFAFTGDLEVIPPGLNRKVTRALGCKGIHSTDLQESDDQ